MLCNFELGRSCNFVVISIITFKVKATESVQYFQFDKDGNMFVFAPGAGCSGEAALVQPGDELFGYDNITIKDENCVASDQSGYSEQVRSDVVVDCTMKHESTSR